MFQSENRKRDLKRQQVKKDARRHARRQKLYKKTK